MCSGGFGKSVQINKGIIGIPYGSGGESRNSLLSLAIIGVTDFYAYFLRVLCSDRIWDSIGGGGGSGGFCVEDGIIGAGAVGIGFVECVGKSAYAIVIGEGAGGSYSVACVKSAIRHYSYRSVKCNGDGALRGLCWSG